MRNPQIHTAIEDRERFCVVCGTVKITKRHGTVADGGNRGVCLPKFSLLHCSPVSCRGTCWIDLVFCDFKGRVNAIKPSHRRTKAAWDTQEVTGNPPSTSSLGTSTMVTIWILVVLTPFCPAGHRPLIHKNRQKCHFDHRARSQLHHEAESWALQAAHAERVT